MKPEQWPQVEELYQAVLEQAPHERAAYLEQACAGDAALRREVESLLCSDDRAADFTEQPVVALAAQALADEQSTMQIGQRISHYQILSRLGAGGMGVVYLAQDSSLKRQVAIKLLPAQFTADAERVQRFEQEARAASSLNHPNILTVHDFGTYKGAPFIVTELLEGEELRAPLSVGALPVRKAIGYAQQIAAGLTAAYEKGIVHRDLKPENLFVMKDGRVKILDFGLAKLRPPQNGAEGAAVSTKKQLTSPGTVMGTVAYMSPEQVRGEAVDHRSDLFSFGLILFEMLRGERAFQRATIAETMAAILKEDPPELSESNAKIPPQLENILRHCLEKNPEMRFQSARDLGFALESLSLLGSAGILPAPSAGTAARPSHEDGAASATDTSARSFASLRSQTAGETPALPGVFLVGRERLAWIAAAGLLLVSLISLPFAVKYLRLSPPAALVAARFTIAAPEKATSIEAPELSPDGRHLVFAATMEGKTSLWLRPLGSLTAQPLPGTEGVYGFPLWSPDSRSLGFFAGNELRKLDLAGGAPQMLCKSPGDTGLAVSGTWNRDGVILFSGNAGIYRVPATGGEPVLTLRSDPPGLNRRPVFLPDGRHFLVRKTTTQGTAEIHLAALDRQETSRLLVAESQARYANGHLLFARAGALLAAPFNADSLKLTGEPFVVADKVRVSGNANGHFAVSDNGSLVYDANVFPDNQQLTWIDRAGKPLGTVGPPGEYLYPRLSPNGKRLAVGRRDPQSKHYDIYVIDLTRGADSRLTFDPGSDSFPVWSPDGSRIIWGAYRDGAFHIYQKQASGVGPEELLLKADVSIIPGSWSADGRFLLYTRTDPKTKQNLWTLPLAGDRQPALFLQTPFTEIGGHFSPDGRWIAYQSDDQGRFEVYVQTFPASGGKWQISTSGATQPWWRSDGKELYYLSADGKLMAVEVKLGGSFEAGAPRTLFDLAPVRALSRASYAVTAAGDRFLFVTAREEAASLQFTVVTNWMAEMKK